MTAKIQLDFSSEDLFRTRSVATDLVTSIDTDAICCATLPCHFGQTRNVSVAIHSIFLNSTSMSSATGGYLVVLERFGQNRDPASRNDEQTKSKPSFVWQKVLIRCSEITCVCVFLTGNHDFCIHYNN